MLTASAKMKSSLALLFSILACWYLGPLPVVRCSNRQFLHISDIHYDPGYVEGGNREKMCRKTVDSSGEGPNAKIPDSGASKYGSYTCDSPKLLVESAFLAMKKYVPNPDFILWTGDNSAHDDALTQKDVMSNLRFVTRKLDNIYPGVQVIPVLGNHDSAPSNFFPDSKNESTNNHTYSDYITDGSFGHWLDPEKGPSAQFKECGYYMLKKPNYDGNVTQTFIVLNTALYYGNKALDPVHYPLDPCGQFEWLRKTLEECKPSERVFIVAHVPPGYFEHNATEPMFSNENYTRAYLDIVTQKDNAKKIVAHFYGHTHTDSFRLFMDDATHEPVGLAFIAPSITPLAWVRDGVNPSFRAYEYDPQGRVIKDYTQYYVPLDRVIDPDEYDYPEDNDQDYKDDEYDDPTGPSRKSERRRSAAGKSFSKRQDDAAVKNVTSTTVQPANVNATLNDTNADDDDIANPDSISVTTIAPISEHDVKDLANDWELAYTAALDFNLESMSVKNMYKVYLSIKDYPHNETFKSYWRHAFVKRDNTDGLDCDDNCKKVVICTFTNLRKDEFKDCLVESGLPHESTVPPVINANTSPPILATVSTTTSTSSTTSTTSATPTTKWSQQNLWTSKSPEIGIQVPEDKGSDSTASYLASSKIVNGIVIGVALGILVALFIAGFIRYKRIRRRRYRSQEFLLDSFRYDGYSQLDQP